MESGKSGAVTQAYRGACRDSQLREQPPFFLLLFIVSIFYFSLEGSVVGVGFPCICLVVSFGQRAKVH